MIIYYENSEKKIDKFIGDNGLQKEYGLDLIALSFYRIFDIEQFKKIKIKIKNN